MSNFQFYFTFYVWVFLIIIFYILHFLSFKNLSTSYIHIKNLSLYN